MAEAFVEGTHLGLLIQLRLIHRVLADLTLVYLLMKGVNVGSLDIGLGLLQVELLGAVLSLEFDVGVKIPISRGYGYASLL